MSTEYSVSIKALFTYENLYYSRSATLSLETETGSDGKVNSVKFTLRIPEHSFTGPSETLCHKGYVFDVNIENPSFSGSFHFYGSVINCFRIIDLESGEAFGGALVIKFSDPTKRIDPSRFQSSCIQFEKSGVRVRSRFSRWRLGLFTLCGGRN